MEILYGDTVWCSFNGTADRCPGCGESQWGMPSFNAQIMIDAHKNNAVSAVMAAVPSSPLHSQKVDVMHVMTWECGISHFGYGDSNWLMQKKLIEMHDWDTVRQILQSP